MNYFLKNIPYVYVSKFQYFIIFNNVNIYILVIDIHHIFIWIVYIYSNLSEVPTEVFWTLKSPLYCINYLQLVQPSPVIFNSNKNLQAKPLLSLSRQAGL